MSWNRKMKYLVDRIGGQVVEESEYTNARVISASSTTLAGSNQTLASVTVPPGAECVIYRMNLFGSAASSYALTYTQTGDTQTAYFNVAAGANEDPVGSVKEPLMALINGTTGNLLVNLNVVSATSGDTYTGSVWYILR